MYVRMYVRIRVRMYAYVYIPEHVTLRNVDRNVVGFLLAN